MLDGIPMECLTRRKIVTACQRVTVALATVLVLLHCPISRANDNILVVGFQGWFACPSDSAGDGFSHWFNKQFADFDLIPDVEGLKIARPCKTSLMARDGRAIDLFSDQQADTILQQFRWMSRYGIKNVALQRFAGRLGDAKAKASDDRVLLAVERAATITGRRFFIMYDLSSTGSKDLALVARDWSALIGNQKVLGRAYLAYRQRPLLGLWGVGFRNSRLRPGDVADLLVQLRRAEPRGQLSLMEGIPTYWSLHTNDASADPGWDRVWFGADVLSPWTVGRYSEDREVDAYTSRILQPQMRLARAHGVTLMPVVFPGFSSANLLADAPTHRRVHGLNEIPRRCGRLFLRQIRDDLAAGASSIYVAMFDEYNEGTAISKSITSSRQVPALQANGDSFLALDEDGCRLPSDYYLRLTQGAVKALEESSTHSREERRKR